MKVLLGSDEVIWLDIVHGVKTLAFLSLCILNSFLSVYLIVFDYDLCIAFIIYCVVPDLERLVLNFFLQMGNIWCPKIC